MDIEERIKLEAKAKEFSLSYRRKILPELDDAYCVKCGSKPKYTWCVGDLDYKFKWSITWDKSEWNCDCDIPDCYGIKNEHLHCLCGCGYEWIKAVNNSSKSNLKPKNVIHIDGKITKVTKGHISPPD